MLEKCLYNDVAHYLLWFHIHIIEVCFSSGGIIVLVIWIVLMVIRTI